MGSVWAAVHLELDAPVAIKLEHPTSALPKRPSATRREARAAARLRSPHVVRTFDFGLDDGVSFIAMELLVGESLKARLERRTPLAAREAAEITRQASIGLDLAHRERIIHRDIKPSNLFLACEGDTEIVKVLDFGIAKWLDPDAGGELRSESARLVGSAAYMSPEQARGGSVDHRSDVWSLAVVAYETLVGMRPFPGNNIPETLGKICAGAYRAPSAAMGHEYREFDGVFARGLNVDPARRFQSAGELSRAFAAAVAHLPPAAAERVAEGEKPVFGRESDTASLRVATSPPRENSQRRIKPVLGWVVGVTVACAGAASLLLDGSPAREDSPSAPAPEQEQGQAAPALTSAVPSVPSSPPDVVASTPKPVSATPKPSRSRSRIASSALPASSVTPAHRLDPVFGLEVPAP